MTTETVVVKLDKLDPVLKKAYELSDRYQLEITPVKEIEEAEVTVLFELNRNITIVKALLKLLPAQHSGYSTVILFGYSTATLAEGFFKLLRQFRNGDNKETDKEVYTYLISFIYSQIRYLRHDAEEAMGKAGIYIQELHVDKDGNPLSDSGDGEDEEDDDDGEEE